MVSQLSKVPHWWPEGSSVWSEIEQSCVAVNKDELKRQHLNTVLGSAEQVWLLKVNAVPLGRKASPSHDTVLAAQQEYCGHDLVFGTQGFQTIFQRQQQPQLSTGGTYNELLTLVTALLKL